MTRDRSTAHTIKRRRDKRNLGRWTWVTVKGKQNRKTTVITTYRAQNQLGTLRQINVAIQPEEMWEKDLTKLIREKKSIGEVIIMGDFNSDLNDIDAKASKFFNQLEMREGITEKYGAGPATFQFGSRTIDGIFATPGISIRQGGYGAHPQRPPMPMD